MRRLPDNFQRNGFSFRKIRREDLWCLYEGTYCEGLVCYFVFKIQVKPKKNFKNKWIPAYEKLPHGEAYGRSGWVLKDLGSAVMKFNYLMKRNQNVALVRRIHK